LPMYQFRSVCSCEWSVNVSASQPFADRLDVEADLQQRLVVEYEATIEQKRWL